MNLEKFILSLFTLKHVRTKAKDNVFLVCGKSSNGIVKFIEWHAPAYSFFFWNSEL